MFAAGLTGFWHSRPAAASSAVTWPVPTVLSRAHWGADERLRIAGPTYDDYVQKIVVHHTATPNHPRDARAVIRSIYRYHLARGYSDIAYHFLIDEQGRIYEGRWAANYPKGQTHSGEDRLRRQVRGAHSLNHNARTIGVALLGTFSAAAPPAAMVNSLVEVLAWKCGRWHLDPMAAAPYRNGIGDVRALPTLLVHRDIRQTSCPGDAVRAVMPGVRKRVAAAVAQRVAAERAARYVTLPGGIGQTRRPARP